MSALLREDELEVSKTKRTTIIEYLKTRDLIDYGMYITKDHIAEMFNLPKLDRNEKDWQLSILAIFSVINAEGFLCTTRGQNGSIYIYEKHEMADVNERANKQDLLSLKNRHRALSRVDINDLDKEHAKKHEFERLRNAWLEIEMTKKLRERCR